MSQSREKSKHAKSSTSEREATMEIKIARRFGKGNQYPSEPT
jgi:hypothetical protein